MTEAELATPATPNAHWPAELARLFDVVRHTIEQTRNPGDPGALAVAVVLAVAADMGGRPVYLPNGARLKKALRDRRIYAEFDGRNHRELAARYDLCEYRVRQIIEQQRQTARRPPL